MFRAIRSDGRPNGRMTGYSEVERGRSKRAINRLLGNRILRESESGKHCTRRVSLSRSEATAALAGPPLSSVTPPLKVS